MNDRKTNDTARENNIAFLELYKSVDRFIRDAYASDEGVSEYIRMMETKDSLGRRYAAGWADDYRMLKHARWVRNRLTHDLGYDSEILEENDYGWLVSFRNRLCSSYDPIAILSREERLAAQRRAEEWRRRQAQIRDQAAESSKPAAQPRRTLWQRIKAFFLGE